MIHADFLETGAAKIEHFGGWSTLQQCLDLGTGERGFEKIALVKLKFFLREELPRFAAGVSAGPAIEFNFHGLYPPLLFIRDSKAHSCLPCEMSAQRTGDSIPRLVR